MGSILKNHWHWEMLKLITKQIIKKKSEGKIIDQRLINNLKSNRNLTIGIFKQVIRADHQLQAAVNQFNFAREKEEVDYSIYFMKESEEEFKRVLDVANKELRQLI